jgi:exopolysaccharide production protein ExoZ
MFFYVVLALSLLVYRRRAVWLAAGLVVATVAICNLVGDYSVYTRFYARDISMEFVIGLASYYVCRAFPERTAIRIRLPMLLLLVASALGLAIFQGFVLHNVIPRSITLGGMSFLLVTSASLLSQGGWDTNAAWVVVIGDASYILYLIHPYCEYFISRVIAKRVPWLDIASGPGMLFTVSLVVITAVALHLMFERPMIAFLNRKFGGRRKSAEFATKEQARLVPANT